MLQYVAAKSKTLKQKKLHIVADSGLDVGSRIAHIRQEKGFTQSDFADLLGISRGKLSQIEIGRVAPGLDVIRSIASKCSVTYQYIIDGENSTYQSSLVAEPNIEYGRLEKLKKEIDELRPVIEKLTRLKL
jgi:transcriptional regulator with XRE-family HTH domain